MEEIKYVKDQIEKQTR